MAEGWRSLEADPTNDAAHRLLADGYARLRRHEIARASELLQAQLLQPVSNNPVQPLSAAKDPLVLSPFTFQNETARDDYQMFSRDQVTASLRLIGGGNATLAQELIVSGVEGPGAFSIGQYHYESDGYRANNDLEHDFLTAFAQYAVSAETSLQAELRHQETESGDLRMRFDDAADRTVQRTDLDRDSAGSEPGRGRGPLSRIGHCQRLGSPRSAGPHAAVP